MVSERGGRPFARFLFLSRMTGATRLHSPTYEEVYRDGSATLQAVAVVVLAALARGIGVHVALGTLPVAALSYAISWGVLVFIIFIVGTVLFAAPSADASFVHLVRTLGFAQAPFVFVVFGMVLSLGSAAHLVLLLATTAWVFAAMTVAVRQALGYPSTLKAVVVVGAGFLPWELWDLFIDVSFT